MRRCVSTTRYMCRYTNKSGLCRMHAPLLSRGAERSNDTTNKCRVGMPTSLWVEARRVHREKTRRSISDVPSSLCKAANLRWRRRQHKRLVSVPKCMSHCYGFRKYAGSNELSGGRRMYSKTLREQVQYLRFNSATGCDAPGSACSGTCTRSSRAANTCAAGSRAASAG